MLRDRLIAALLMLVALIHLLPVSGVLGGEYLQRLYALPADDPNLQLLLRHRAVLFALLGGLLLAAALRRALVGLALIAGLASVVSFLLLAWLTPGVNAALQRVVWADWLALAALLVASTLWWRSRHAA